MAEVVSEHPVTETTDRAFVPSVLLLARIRRLVIAVIVAGLAYSLSVASKAICAGGVNGAGEFVDSSGNTTDAAPSCLSLHLGPSPVMFVAFAAIVVIALTRVIKRARNEQDALRTVDRAVIVVVVLAVASIVIAQVWFSLIPVSDWTPTGSYSFLYPFPFGSVELSIAPMSTG